MRDLCVSWLVLLLLGCKSVPEPAYVPGPPLVYRCAKPIMTAGTRMTPWGIMIVPVERLERSRYESSPLGVVMRIAPCTET